MYDSFIQCVFTLGFIWDALHWQHRKIPVWQWSILGSERQFSNSFFPSGDYISGFLVVRFAIFWPTLEILVSPSQYMKYLRLDIKLRPGKFGDKDFICINMKIMINSNKIPLICLCFTILLTVFIVNQRVSPLSHLLWFILWFVEPQFTWRTLKSYQSNKVISEGQNKQSVQSLIVSHESRWYCIKSCPWNDLPAGGGTYQDGTVISCNHWLINEWTMSFAIIQGHVYQFMWISGFF